VDDALPQPLPLPRRRHDGRAGLPDLTQRTGDRCGGVVPVACRSAS
jgi:hypothetical protein